MHIESVGLRERPFHNKGRPTTFVQYRSQKEAFEFLEKILTDDRGIGLLHGPESSGKSVLVNRFVEKLPAELSVAVVDGARLKTHELLTKILSQFGYDVKLESADELLSMLNVIVVQQARMHLVPLLILESINEMFPSTLCALCKLATLTTHRRFALRIILVGNHDFRRIIDSPSMEPIAQRMVGSFKLQPLTSKETLVYLYSKLRSCGVDRPDDIFSFDTCDKLHLASAGWPGKLDSIAMSIIDQADELPIRLEEIDHPDLKTDDDWPQLIVTLDGRTMQEIKLVTSRSLIGRSILSDIVIDDEFVSAQHALLIRDHGRVILVDLKSASGTFVNSRNVQTTVLRNNDIISLGDHRIKMIYPNSLAPEEIDDPDLSDTARMRRIAGAQHVNNGNTGIATQSRLAGKA